MKFILKSLLSILAVSAWVVGAASRAVDEEAAEFILERSGDRYHFEARNARVKDVLAKSRE